MVATPSAKHHIHATRTSLARTWHVGVGSIGILQWHLAWGNDGLRGVATPKAEIDLIEKRLKDLIKEKEGRQ
jgi:hypothetical protein